MTQQMRISEYHEQYEMAVFIDRECRNEILNIVADGNGFTVSTFGGSVFHVVADHPVYFPASVDANEWRIEAEEVPATAEAALTYREPVAAFVAPTGLASEKRGEMFDWTHPNFRPNAECRFEAADGEAYKGRIVRVTVYGGERVGWVTYRNDDGIRLTERVPAYRVWPYGGIQRGEQKTTWGAREREIRNRAFEKGSDD